MKKIPVGVSQCLIGDRVRYDASHKYDANLVELLGPHLEFHAVCPEMAIGLGAPRPPIQLIAANGAVRVRGVREPENDFTQALEAQAEATVRAMPFICGFVLTEKSPSCGVDSTKIFDECGELTSSTGRGIFARRLAELVPSLPLIESAALADPSRRQHFLQQVREYHRLTSS